MVYLFVVYKIHIYRHIDICMHIHVSICSHYNSLTLICVLCYFTTYEQTTSRGEPDTNGLTQWLRSNLHNKGKVYMTFVACTDDKDSVEYLDVLDNIVPQLDVCSDYTTEKQQIQNARGRLFPFRYVITVCYS